jgi:hypothetical protein
MNLAIEAAMKGKTIDAIEHELGGEGRP